MIRAQNKAYNFVSTGIVNTCDGSCLMGIFLEKISSFVYFIRMILRQFCCFLEKTKCSFSKKRINYEISDKSWFTKNSCFVSALCVCALAL
jgi:hypothetical protein